MEGLVLVWVPQVVVVSQVLKSRLYAVRFRWYLPQGREFHNEVM